MMTWSGSPKQIVAGRKAGSHGSRQSCSDIASSRRAASPNQPVAPEPLPAALLRASKRASIMEPLQVLVMVEEPAAGANAPDR
jgi:hypothetical protein